MAAAVTSFKSEFASHLHVVQETMACLETDFSKFCQAVATALQEGGKIFFFGNGGSAADAQHLATEFVVRFKLNRKALPALALTTDTSALTAISNDFGFDHLFERQIEALCTSRDLVIGISTSGNSENVIRALLAAKERGAVTAALGGGDGGRMKSLVDHALIVPSNVTARIQEVHILIGHALCGYVEEELCRSPLKEEA